VNLGDGLPVNQNALYPLGRLSDDRLAGTSCGAACRLPTPILLHFGAPFVDHRHQMTGALARAWALRPNLSFYDALYVALAAALAAPW
jgi:hypothetical protein